MPPNPTLLLLALRTLHLATAATTLALSIHAVRLVHLVRAVCATLHECPDLRGFGPAVYFATFASAWGVLGALLGLGSVAVGKWKGKGGMGVMGKVVLGVDGVGCAVFLAAGIVSLPALSFSLRSFQRSRGRPAVLLPVTNESQR